MNHGPRHSLKVPPLPLCSLSSCRPRYLASSATTELMPRWRHPQLSRRSLQPNLQSFFVPLTTLNRGRRCGSCWYWCSCCPRVGFAFTSNCWGVPAAPPEAGGWSTRLPGVEDSEMEEEGSTDKLSVARRSPNGQDHGQVHNRRRSLLQRARRLPGPEFGYQTKIWPHVVTAH